MSVWPSGGLLVSSVNGGGLFAILAGRVERWSKVDTTGIALCPDGALLARQAEGRAELRWLRDRDVARVQLVDRSLDLHDLLWQAGRLYVVATQINTVFEFDGAFVELRHWTFPGEEDSQHINSVCVHQGRLLASRFGTFRDHRGYKGATRGAGEVFDVESGEVLLRGLSQPHSLVSDRELLWLCDSEARMLRCFREWGEVGAWPLDGYPRGLAIHGGTAYVGLSRSRNAEPGSIDGGCVVALHLRDMSELGRVEIPADEVYDIRVVDAGAIPDLRLAAMADAIAEYDTQVDQRNRAVEAALREGGAATLGAALHQANLRIAELEAIAATQGRELKILRDDRERNGIRTQEEAQWLAWVEADAARVRSLAEAQAPLLVQYASATRSLQDALGRSEQSNRSLRDLAAAQEAFIDAVTGSRSWRWTRFLRREEPTPPAAPMPAPTAPDIALPTPAPPPAPGVAPPPSRADLPLVGLAFDESPAPVVSVLVAARGNFDATRACLESIRRAGAGVAFEVILVEDAAGDLEMHRFRHVPGLGYRRDPANVGSPRSMNAALALARGEYVHYLDGDTLVAPGWLDALLRTFQLCRHCGIAGSRLVAADGHLEAAGTIVWANGDSSNIGGGDDPADPAHAAVREVDYVSGAALLVRTDVLRELGGFDERYSPAGHGDADLAFRLRERGLRTYYQPGSTVVLQSVASAVSERARGDTASKAGDRRVFIERWQAVLASGQLPPGQHWPLARCRGQLKKWVLVADRHLPRTDRDAGSRAMWEFMRLLQERGFEVKFWSFEPDADPRARDLLCMHGIEIAGDATSAGGFDAWIEAHGCYLDYAVLSRPHVADMLVAAVRTHSSARVIYYGHDVHHLRLETQHAIEPSVEIARQAADVRRLEEAVWARADAVLYPSAGETRYVQSWIEATGAAARALTVPLFAYVDVPDRPAAAEPAPERDSVLFVGGFAHAPNADAVRWFLGEVWPLVHREHGGLRTIIVGADPPPDVQAFAGPGVQVAGNVSEDDLREAYRTARVAVAPLRFGAGVKGKVLEAMRLGVPCVTTHVGAQGLEAAAGLRVSDDAAGFARHILDLASGDEAWREAARAGLEHIRDNFSERALWGAIATVMDPAMHRNVASRLALVVQRSGPSGTPGPT